MVGLTRSDFDFKINIDKTWDYKKGNGVGPTKNEASERSIDVGKKVMAVFNKLFRVVPANIHGLVFHSPELRFKAPTNEGVNKLLRNMLKFLKIPHITLSQGVNILCC